MASLRAKIPLWALDAVEASAPSSELLVPNEPGIVFFFQIVELLLKMLRAFSKT